MKLKYDFIIQKVGDTQVAVPAGDDVNRFSGIIKLNSTGAVIFKMLKNERNNINHFSTKEGRASLKEIDHAIRLFLELGRELYREVENQP